MNKVQGMNNSSASGKASASYGGSSSRQTSAQHYSPQASSHSKAADLSQIKEFIRKNPDVKHEVEEILKETGTVVPGL
ncbi:hypothetical protein [Paenibacillus sp. 7541]|nr:hypothetical protein [Paenibacillus sp. 7541]